MKTSEQKSEKEWRDSLTKEQYHVLRMKGTEPAFTGKYWNLKKKGKYYCAGCGTLLFESETKYDSGCGWPSFYSPAIEKNVITKRDSSNGMIRTEVLCRKCGGHLGHVFKDGPEPTGLRFCINSISLDFMLLL
ncbi:MAG: peptide-methionine (R)-S-oxide reductase MsrB [Candidatus Hodarchaeales archaeon]